MNAGNNKENVHQKIKNIKDLLNNVVDCIEPNSSNYMPNNNQPSPILHDIKEIHHLDFGQDFKKILSSQKSIYRNLLKFKLRCQLNEDYDSLEARQILNKIMQTVLEFDSFSLIFDLKKKCEYFSSETFQITKDLNTSNLLIKQLRNSFKPKRIYEFDSEKFDSSSEIVKKTAKFAFNCLYQSWSCGRPTYLIIHYSSKNSIYLAQSLTKNIFATDLIQSCIQTLFYITNTPSADAIDLNLENIDEFILQYAKFLEELFFLKAFQALKKSN